jgi:hypothetical protein
VRFLLVASHYAISHSDRLSIYLSIYFYLSSSMPPLSFSVFRLCRVPSDLFTLHSSSSPLATHSSRCTLPETNSEPLKSLKQRSMLTTMMHPP